MSKRVENLIWVLIALVVVIGVIAIVSALLFGGMYRGGGFYPAMMGGFYGMGIIMPIIGIVSVIAVIIFIYLLIEGLRSPYEREPPYRAEYLAKERLARGEITEEEFNRIMEDLRR